MKIPDSNKIISVAMILGLLVVMFIVYKILGGLGLIKTAAKKKQEQAVEDIRTLEYFNPDLYKGKSFKSIGTNAASQYAEDIRKAIRGVGTNEELIYSTFNKLYNKLNISEVADAYGRKYSRDMQSDLLDDLGNKEMATLMELINSLPKN